MHVLVLKLDHLDASYKLLKDKALCHTEVGVVLFSHAYKQSVIVANRLISIRSRPIVQYICWQFVGKEGDQRLQYLH